MSETKSRWQAEYDALPAWAKKMVDGLSGQVGYGFTDDSPVLSIISDKKKRREYTSFNVALKSDCSSIWFDGFCEMLALAKALTAPWPPPPAPLREKRAFNIVELVADDDDNAFDQPCAFGHRVNGHAVYCHNEAWPDAPRKCRRGKDCAEIYGIPEDANRHEDCPGFVANPDTSP